MLLRVHHECHASAFVQTVPPSPPGTMAVSPNTHLPDLVSQVKLTSPKVGKWPVKAAWPKGTPFLGVLLQY